jgi:hypothetical protein
MIFHPYWTASDPAVARTEASSFFGHLSMMGGMLFVVAFGAGAYSVDALMNGRSGQQAWRNRPRHDRAGEQGNEVATEHGTPSKNAHHLTRKFYRFFGGGLKPLRLSANQLCVTVNLVVAVRLVKSGHSPRSADARYSPESRHWLEHQACPLWAIRRHNVGQQKVSLFDHFIGK